MTACEAHGARPVRCPWHGTHERCTVARGTEPRLFAYGSRCAAYAWAERVEAGEMH